MEIIDELLVDLRLGLLIVVEAIMEVVRCSRLLDPPTISLCSLSSFHSTPLHSKYKQFKMYIMIVIIRNNGIDIKR